MSPDQIEKIMQALTMGNAKFARLLCVNISTIYRWRAAGAYDVDPLHEALLEFLWQEIQRRGSERCYDWACELHSTLVVRGPLAALALVLKPLVQK